MKDPATVVGPYDTVLIPRGSTKTDWEVELGVVIGTEARYLDGHRRAADCIGGYVISHDVSERAFQLERGGQWDKGKSCETFNPLAPDLVTRTRSTDVQRLEIGLEVNGVLARRAAPPTWSSASATWSGTSASSWCCTPVTSSTPERRPVSLWERRASPISAPVTWSSCPSAGWAPRDSGSRPPHDRRPR